MTDFARPKDGFRFRFSGMKTNAAPDALPPDKYALAVNVRGTKEDSIQTRPGQTLKFNTGGGRITDLRGYTAAAGSETPRILARDAIDRIWLDDGTLVGTLAGGGSSLGVALIPFRPNQSPVPYLYIANGSDYQKFSAPPAVTARKVGIAEPQAPPDAGFTNTLFWAPFSTPTVSGGTAGPPGAATRVADTVANVFPWPAPNTTIYTIQVGTGQPYQRFQSLQIGLSNIAVVLDVYQEFTTAINIQGIFYFAGTTGRCVVVPANVATTPGTEGESLYTQAYLSGLRRGALIKIGTETVMVLSVSKGPDGSVCFETSTSVNHTTADAITSVPSIQIRMQGGVPVAAQAISSALPAFFLTVTAGVGTLAGVTANPFAFAGQSLQPDDYITFGINVDNLANLAEMKILIDVGDGTFTKDFYYFTVRPSDITAAVQNVLTQLAAAQTVIQRAIIDDEQAIAAKNQGKTASSAQLSPGSGVWSQIVFPISALTRVGTDQTRTLQNVSKIQFLYNATGTVNILMDNATVQGGFQPDVGDIGAPYLYHVRPRASGTGVIGNPSPAARYGISARRAAVLLNLPSATYDGQIDTWDIFRYGGAITSWRYVGSISSSSPQFTDNFGDAAVGAGSALDFDDFEPWPSVDVPFGGTATVIGTTARIILPTAEPTNILRFLPGNLVRIDNQNVYTLWTRPVVFSTDIFAGTTTYLLQFLENAGAPSGGVSLTIQEPLIANQKLPYMWGPDAGGTVFACGDVLRLGTLYFAKNNNPDSAPDAYNLEITPPSEALLGGEIVDGLSFVASTERWWALYPQPDNPAQRYNVVQQPLSRGLAAPFGHCNDGRAIYWWAKDGIWSSAKGSLTDKDLFNLFPHESVPGKSITYMGATVQPPDYARTGAFRLTYANGYLYAVYKDTSNTYRCLVYDTHRDAWSVDEYNPQVSVFYHPEQQAGALKSTARYDELLMGNISGSVSAQADNTNDLGGAIPAVVAVGEFDGGDVRAPKQWGDIFLDVLSASPVTVTPVSLGVAVAAAIPVATFSNRQRLPLDIGGRIVSDFLGLHLAWSDNFSVQTKPTELFVWQPSFAVQPPRTTGWYTFGSSFGIDGYMHIRQIAITWVSTAPITLTIVAFDGQSPAIVTIPSSGGTYQKQLFPLTANKGLLYKFQAASAQPFQLFLDDCEVSVGRWSRTEPYVVSKDFGGRPSEQAVL